MNIKTTIIRPSTLAEGTTRQTPTRPLEEIVQQVRQDAVKQSKEYLEETTVPHGGE
ncbi:MAG: hypothetical protein ACYC6N_21030 [Pirellulaceae bacterium]